MKKGNGNYDRRKFIRQSTLATAGLMLTSSLKILAENKSMAANGVESQVYFTKEITPESLMKLTRSSAALPKEKSALNYIWVNREVTIS